MESCGPFQTPSDPGLPVFSAMRGPTESRTAQGARGISCLFSTNVLDLHLYMNIPDPPCRISDLISISCDFISHNVYKLQIRLSNEGDH